MRIMVENHHFAGDRRIVEKRTATPRRFADFDLAMEHVGDAEVEPHRSAAGELDDIAGAGLLERQAFVVGEVGEFGGAGGSV